MKKITVYGTLLEGFGNWSWALNKEGANKLGSHILEDELTMVSLGGFPGLIETPGKSKKIYVETYEVIDSIFKSIESLEGYPTFYTRKAVKTPFGDSEVYVLASKGAYDRHKEVPADDEGVVSWKKYRMG